MNATHIAELEELEQELAELAQELELSESEDETGTTAEPKLQDLIRALEDALELVRALGSAGPPVTKPGPKPTDTERLLERLDSLEVAVSNMVGQLETIQNELAAFREELT